jgi:histidyl-tRNA synthetase
MVPRFQAPKGTRDFYPADLLRRRYLEKLWRDTSIRHGFEEIDGPAFEESALYAVKSGEGILSEMFGVFSGKDPAELDAIRAGKPAPLALRAEFTPTLARMYAAKAGSLAKPTRWFWMQNCYRAERPQRGRLREFGQWNCDVIGAGPAPDAGDAPGDPSALDAELIACCVGLLEASGLTGAAMRVKIGSRPVVGDVLVRCGVKPESAPAVLQTLDKRAKLPPEVFRAEAVASGLDVDAFDAALRERGEGATRGEGPLGALWGELSARGVSGWCTLDLGIARGLAYYTGAVFEVIADGERAVAGGGRYDQLIELFGGPPTPAVGFGMGDVVLSLLLQDKGLMPDERQAMEFLSAPPASYRPEAFVIAAGQEAEAHVRPLVSGLRRGRPGEAWLGRADRKPWDADRYDAASGGVRPLHSRQTSKTTRNLGKLLQDASAQRARLAVIIENAAQATLKDLDTGVQDEHPTPMDRIGAALVQRLDRA